MEIPGVTDGLQEYSQSPQDGLPDELDLIVGLDPLQWDIDRDDDQDGIPNGRELEWHLNPRVEQSQRMMRDRYRYDRSVVGHTDDGRTLFDFTVRHITLVPGAQLLNEGLPVGQSQS